MTKKFLLIIISVLLLLSGCKEDESYMQNQIEGDTVQLKESEMVFIDSEKKLVETDMASFQNTDSFDFISGYENQISTYSETTNEIKVLDESGGVLDSLKLKEKYRVVNFKQVGINEYLLGNFTKIDDELNYSVILVKEGTEAVIYDDQLNEGNKLQMITRGLTLLEDTLYIVDFDNKPFKAIDNQLVPIDIQEECIDVTTVDGNVGILTNSYLAIMDVATNQLVEKMNFDTSRPLKVTHSKDSGLKILTENAVYLQQNENEFTKVPMKSLQSMFLVEGFYVFSSGQLIMADDIYQGYFDFEVEVADEVIEDQIVVGIIFDFLPIARALQKLDFGDINIDTIVYQDLEDQFSGESFLTKISADYLTKSAPDIIAFGGWAYLQDYINQDYLVDLNQLIENDPTFDRNLYETNLFDASTIDGEMYYIFTNPTPYYIEFNADLLEKLDITLPENLTLNDLYDIYLDANDDLDNPEYHIGYHFENNPEYVFNNMYNGYFYSDLKSLIDNDKKTASFESEDFINYMEKAKVLFQGHMNSSFDVRDLYANLEEGVTHPELKNHLFHIGYMQNGFQYYMEVYQSESIIREIPAGFISDKKPIVEGTYLTISADSENIEESWEVLKMLISGEADYHASEPDYFGGKMAARPFTILKESNDKKIENYKAYEAERTPLLTDEDYQKMEEILRADYTILPLSSFDNEIKEDILRYLNSEISVEELSEILQNKAELYLGE